MKRTLGTLIAIATFLPAHSPASTIITLDSGWLQTSTAGTSMPLDGLLQLVISTSDSTFTAPTDASFIGSSLDDVVFQSWGLNNFAGAGTGSDEKVITVNYTGGISAGDPFMLRWYPSLTTGSLSPGAGTSYGQFRTDSVAAFPTTMAWVLPADTGSAQTLQFLTTSFGGANPDSAGVASLQISAVPEPSSFLALAGLGLFGFVGRRVRRSSGKA